MTSPRYRVLVVDDSAFARKVIRDVLTSTGDLEVIGVARDGLEALEKISDLEPDVVTLDLSMPNLDGLGVLNALPRGRGPRAVIVTQAEENSESALAALDAGAVALVHKPTALATDRMYELSDELVGAVRAAGTARSPTLLPAAERVPWLPGGEVRKRLVVIGASTGGPQALTRLLSAIPAGFPAPIALVLHIPIGYTAPFAERLNRECQLEVVEASEGLELRPGLVVVARAGLHLKIAREGGLLRAALDVLPMNTAHRPSVDVLFESAAAAVGPDVLGVVLTGMGDDGLAGARLIHAMGGELLTEAPSTCVVYGMPRAVFEAGLGAWQAPLPELPHHIVERVHGMDDTLASR
ncbi:chemotaxis-specific protein-glutamate methyltransferase CheB [Archangium sp.]|uniref:chemotaxis-specific protein-glutamate methyltransferase CheB n=1 Tax=Archangium sp. TaxID=1872627 RepID=UPI002D4D39E5|nr:chemotaxis-specific protein-glutamate methyltransferase CheB [Archangium sp.]HYO53587.1 chemotaxis-specific protein-glutamate methyltransferase CheB [Archangium sp.]